MKYIMEHYGAAILVSVALVALGMVVVALCTGEGYVAEQFKQAIQEFFSEMGKLNTSGA